jgi:hypothetical protein
MANRSSLPDPHRERTLDSSFARAPFTPRPEYSIARDAQNDVSQALAELSIVRDSLAQQPFSQSRQAVSPSSADRTADFAGLALSWTARPLHALTSHFSIQCCARSVRGFMTPWPYSSDLPGLRLYPGIRLICRRTPSSVSRPLCLPSYSLLLSPKTFVRHASHLGGSLGNRLITVPVSHGRWCKACLRVLLVEYSDTDSRC